MRQGFSSAGGEGKPRLSPRRSRGLCVFWMKAYPGSAQAAGSFSGERAALSSGREQSSCSGRAVRRSHFKTRPLSRGGLFHIVTVESRRSRQLPPPQDSPGHSSLGIRSLKEISGPKLLTYDYSLGTSESCVCVYVF